MVILKSSQNSIELGKLWGGGAVGCVECTKSSVCLQSVTVVVLYYI